MCVCVCPIAYSEKIHKCEKSLALQASILLLWGGLGLSSCFWHCEPETAFCFESKSPVLCCAAVTSLANCVWGCGWAPKGILSSTLHWKETACYLELDSGRRGTWQVEGQVHSGKKLGNPGHVSWLGMKQRCP